MKEQKGFIHVYTGEGKGKTTAALGLALRAAGAGLRVYVGQFLKKGDFSELNSLKMLEKYITIEQFGRPRKVGEIINEQDKQYAVKGLQRIEEIMAQGEYRVIVLDEINVAINYQLLEEDKVISLLQKRPKGQEVILTGRHAPFGIIKLADLVSEIRAVKHYHDQGVLAREGIEK